jgi:biopolymer transport protein ExbB
MNQGIAMSSRLITCIAVAAALLAIVIEPALAQPAKETVANPYGLDALWNQGDLIARGTLVILALFSLGSWYVLVTKLVQSLKLGREAHVARAAVFNGGDLLTGARQLKEGGTFRFIVETGVAAERQLQGSRLGDNVDRAEWIGASLQQAIDDVQARQQEGLAFLGTVGSTAPFVGLFGTVWGIYHALTAIGIAGQASIDKVAGPVGEALIMTAIGLAVAVPAVLGYNWLVRRNKVLIDIARRFGTDVNKVLLGAVIIDAPVRSGTTQSVAKPAHA